MSAVASAARPAPTSAEVTRRIDQRVTPHGIDWADYEALLAMPEVWFWQDGRLRLFLAEGEAYRQAPRSRLLPDLDPTLIERFMAYPSQTQAVRGLREALRGSGG